VLLVVLVSLFLVQRCGLILYGYSHIAHPSFDETVSGVLAWDLLDGAMRAPLFVYQGLARSGDSLIEGFLLVPFFKLWGRTLFSLKLLALCSAFFSLLCWIALMRRYQGVWAAIIFVSLFAFPPPMFARLNLVGSFASHHLVNPFIAAQLLLFFRIVEGGAAKKSSWMWFGFGLLAGLGTFTFYTYIIFNSFCILFLIIVRPRTITLSRTFLFFGGALIGFLPWIIRSLFSGAGGSYLVSILKRITLDFWSFIQTFCFILPHSLGYSYPSRAMGIISPLFVLLMVVMGGVIIARVLNTYVSLPLGGVQKKCEAIPLPLLQGLFFICFPLFFLSCLSLSSLLIGPVPFEYWPRIGFFGYFSTADVYRYRWLHPLYPFYFAICAVGISSCFTVMLKTRAVRVIAVSVLMFFLCWGLVSGVKLYSINDSGKIFSYRGYDYDQMAHRLMLSDMNRLSLEEAQHLTRAYPAENRGEAYRCLGTQVALAVVDHEDAETIVTHYLQGVPSPYVNDFIYGVVRAAQSISEESFQPVKRAVTRNYPADFYINWGFRHVGYKYYGLLLNRKKVLDAIPALEKWFYADFLENFNQQTHRSDGKNVENDFFRELGAVPLQYQPAMMRGVGKLVGAEMLFDPLLSPDYPLDSSFGEQWGGALQDAFYEGVGSGFAETLARFWRTLLLPDDPEDPRYRAMLDMEWERCQTLMVKVSPSHAALIKNGFVQELHQRSFDDGMRKYLNRKLAKRRPPLS
jgi:hypothetical protein